MKKFHGMSLMSAPTGARRSAKLQSTRPAAKPTDPEKKRSTAWLSDLVAPLKGSIWAAILLNLGAIAAGCVFALSVGAFVGGWISPGGEDQALHWLVFAACAALVRSVLIAVAEATATDCGSQLASAARTRVLAHIRAVGAGTRHRATVGQKITELVDRTADLASYASAWLPGRVVAIVGPLIVVGFVVGQSWIAAVVLLFCVPLMPLFIWLTASETQSIAARQQAALNVLAARFQERGRKVGLIKSFNAVAREAQALRADARDLSSRTMAVLKVAFLSGAVLDFFAALSVALVAVYAGFKLLGIFPIETGETLTLAHALTALILAPEFFAPLRRMSALHHDRARALAAAQALSAWLEQDNASQRRPIALTAAPSIVFENVNAEFDGGKAVFAHALSFVAKPGTITLLSGQSGTGKSTVLSLLMGRARLASGSVLIDGAKFMPDSTIAGSAAWVGQSPWAMSGSLRENLTIVAPNASDQAVVEALLKAGLGQLIDARGLEAPVGRDGASLSGGERQRLAFARAILSGAPVWLLDEPTAYLDPDAEEHIWQTLQTLKPGRTILLASHAASARQIADQVVELSSLSEHQ
jgi:ATP-binding cassette subfamily C protein CydD